MGFNTWYAFRAAISEQLVLTQAQALVSSGLSAAGYTYFNLDDGWASAARAADGTLQPDPAKFPSGMPWLAAQLHGLGLKMGIYTSIGTQTCQHLTGSGGHYALDAQTFANWGIDLVKVDLCGGLPSYTNQDTLTEDYRLFGQALRDFNPSVVYSQELPVYQMGKTGFLKTVQDSAGFANMWRVAPDEYPLTQANAYPAMQSALAADLHLHGYAGPGHWNDLDMVAPGYPGISGWTVQDLRNQLAVWAMEASPLLISADLTALPAAAVADLSNQHLIAIDQSGQQCGYSVTVGNIQALVKPDPLGGQAVCFVNMGSGAASALFTLDQLNISTPTATATDVWAGTTGGAFSAASINLSASQTRLLQINPV
jgi:alpha-galactosidase